MRTIVIGGGITGLAAAFTLQDRARRSGSSLDLTVLESADRAGGHAWTLHDDGYLVEAGPNGFLDREPGPLELARDLGIESELVEARPEAKRRFIVRGGRLRRVPESPPLLFSSDALSPWGKLRLLLEPWARAAPADVEESVYDFARRRIGAEAADMLVDAAISGISAGDSRALSVKAAFPIMVEMEREHGSLIRAMIARRGSRSRLMSFERGLGSLVDALSDRLGSSLRKNARMTGLAREGGAWRVAVASGETLPADRVVFATAAHAMAPILGKLDPEFPRLLARHPFAGLWLVALAYRTSDVPRPLDGYGYLVTRAEGMRTLGVVWESSLFANRAPEGMALLRAFVGGARHPEVVDLSESEATDLAREELRGVMGVTAAPVRSWAFRWPAAIAQYTHGHLERVAEARAVAARHPGLDLIGTSFDGISFSNAITGARRFAEAFVSGAGVSKDRVAATGSGRDAAIHASPPPAPRTEADARTPRGLEATR